MAKLTPEDIARHQAYFAKKRAKDRQKAAAKAAFGGSTKPPVGPKETA